MNILDRPPFSPISRDLPETVPFVGPEALERAHRRPFKARLGANENLFGPSPTAIHAMRAAADEAWMYGDPECFDLKNDLAALHRIRAENIVVGEGIDGLLGYAVRLFAGPGDRVVTSLGAYPTFNYHVAGFGAKIETAPFRDDHEDLEALADCVRRSGARMVYVSNPDNPMGSWNSAADLEAFIAAIPPDCVICLDEAYVEFAPAAAIPPLDFSRPNLIRFRTFSKAHGLAGLRVGYALGEAQTIRAFERIRNHFGVGRMAQAAARGALSDPRHLAAVVDQVAMARSAIQRIAERAALRALPSAANFVAIDCGRDGAFARAVVDALARHDVFARMPGPAPLNRCIRISVGRPADIAPLEAALPNALDAASVEVG